MGHTDGGAEARPLQAQCRAVVPCSSVLHPGCRLPQISGDAGAGAPSHLRLRTWRLGQVLAWPAQSWPWTWWSSEHEREQHLPGLVRATSGNPALPWACLWLCAPGHVHPRENKEVVPDHCFLNWVPSARGAVQGTSGASWGARSGQQVPPPPRPFKPTGAAPP